MKVADYKDLRVFKLGFDSAMEIFQLSRNWPAEERYSLTDQIRRSSRSVCTNIAEAWRKRRYEAAFISKLSDSDGEAAETEVHLDFALRCGYLPPEKHVALRDQHDHICRQLTKIMDDAAAWCGHGGELREVPLEYFVGASEREERGSVRASEREERGSVGASERQERGSVRASEREERQSVGMASTLHAPDAPRSTNPDAPRSTTPAAPRSPRS